MKISHVTNLRLTEYFIVSRKIIQLKFVCKTFSVLLESRWGFEQSSAHQANTLHWGLQCGCQTRVGAAVSSLGHWLHHPCRSNDLILLLVQPQSRALVHHRPRYYRCPHNCCASKNYKPQRSLVLFYELAGVQLSISFGFPNIHF